MSSLVTPGLGPNIPSAGIDAATQPVVIPKLSTVTQADIDMLNAALASPERQVTLGGQTITYRSIADLLLARDALQTILDAQNNSLRGTPRPRRVFAYYGGRGFTNGRE